MKRLGHAVAMVSAAALGVCLCTPSITARSSDPIDLVSRTNGAVAPTNDASVSDAQDVTRPLLYADVQNPQAPQIDAPTTNTATVGQVNRLIQELRVQLNDDLDVRLKKFENRILEMFPGKKTSPNIGHGTSAGAQHRPVYVRHIHVHRHFYYWDPCWW